MDTLLELPAKLLTPQVGTLAMIAVVIGLAVGLIRNAAARFGVVKAGIAAVVVAIAGIAAWHIPRPAPAQAGPQPAAVKQTQKRVPHKARPRHRRRYVQYPGF
jgi:hypothetical protein